MEESITPMKTGLRYGLMLGLAMSAFLLIAYYSGLQDFSSTDISESLIVSVLNWVILAVFFYLGIKYFKEHNEGHLTLGEGMVTSMFIGLFSGIISVIFAYVFFTFIAPEALQSMSEVAMQTANPNGEMSEEEAAAVKETMDGVMGFVTSPSFMAISTFVSRLFSAVIFGLISSFILKTD